MPNDDFPIRLTLADADHILAACECVLNQDDDGKAALGTGLQPYALEAACRKIESVADIARKGLTVELFGAIVGFVPPPSDDFTGECACGCGVKWLNGEQVLPVPVGEQEDTKP